MGIDPNTLRPGDVFLARHVVQRDGFVFHGGVHFLESFDIVSVERRPIQVGDMVKWHGRDGHRVVAIDEASAWIKCAVDGYVTAAIANLQHAPHDASTGEGA